MTTTFYGYPGRVWGVVFASLNYFVSTLELASSPFTVLPLAESVLETALNGLAAINANRIAGVWQNELSSLVKISTLPFALSPVDAVYFNNRVAAMRAAAPALAALVPTPNMTAVVASLQQGLPAIPDVGVLEFYAGFGFETVPAGLTLANLPATASASAMAFADLAAAVALIEGAKKDYLYDIANRFSIEMSAYAEFLADFYSFASPTPAVLWNQMFVLPTLLMHADLLSGAPASLAAQQDQLLRYLIINVIQFVERFILTVQRPVAQKVEQATVMVGDDLMDIAARSLGDFERWSDIANINNLLPPYLGNTAAPGIATWGNRLLLPVSGAQPPPGVTPNYLFNFLGVDVYVGPINGNMPPWTGDFQLIAGYENLRWALGRRMQTTLGKLIYHTDYGCRIPPEVGNVQTADTANYIAAFGKSCLLSDPRVNSVPYAVATPGPNFSIQFQGSVVPKGFGANGNPLVINEVINSSIHPSTATQS